MNQLVISQHSGRNIRTREIICNLNYDKLLEMEIIPDLEFEPLPVKKYPPYVYQSKSFAHFGMLIDYFVRASLLKIEQLDITLHDTYSEEFSIDRVLEDAYFKTNKCLGDCPFTLSEIISSRNLFSGISTRIVEEYRKVLPKIGRRVEFGVELMLEREDTILGHPDIVSYRKSGMMSILDIKNSSSFKGILKESCLQILTYYALAKLMGKEIGYIGFVFPMQSIVALKRIDWDPTRYLEVLFNSIKPDCDISMNGIPINPLSLLFSLYKMGSHIRLKTEGPYESIRKWIESSTGARPCQMYITNPKSTKMKDRKIGSYEDCHDLIRAHGLSYFTHAPLAINLCSIQHDYVDVIIKNLRTTALMGGKGVVVHTGQYMKLSVRKALKRQKETVSDIIQIMTEETDLWPTDDKSNWCKLLLETPCGEGTEVCTTIDDMANFCNSFTQEEKEYLGICVDTCHVHASGINPIDYLTQWSFKCDGVGINLVHFNDSKNPFGSCIDRHHPPGSGYVGFVQLNEVAAFCTSNEIPMVIE